MEVYLTINLINNNRYIGKDSKSNPKYYGSGTLLKRAIKKYGIENFKKETLCYCSTIEELNEKEIHYITTLKPEYNIAEGGSGGNTLKFKTEEEKKEIFKKVVESRKGYVMTEETKNKISTSNKGKISHWKGKLLSEEHKLKLSIVNTGKKRSEETIQKIRENSKGNTYSLGRIVTEKTRDKISKAKKGISSPKKGIPMSEKSKERMSIAKRGTTRSQEVKDKISKTLKGKIVSDETRKKLSISNTGHIVSLETREKMRNSKLGKPSGREYQFSDEEREFILKTYTECNNVSKVIRQYNIKYNKNFKYHPKFKNIIDILN